MLEKSARSAAIGEGRDAATAIGDRHGGIVAIDNPVQLGSIACTAADVLAYFKFDMKDGDVVFTSDPYRGGTHVQDVTLVAPYAVDNSILLSNSRIGRYSRIRRTIVDTGVCIPESSVIGFDADADRANGHHVTESGIVVVSDRSYQPDFMPD